MAILKASKMCDRVKDKMNGIFERKKKWFLWSWMNSPPILSTQPLGQTGLVLGNNFANIEVLATMNKKYFCSREYVNVCTGVACGVL